MTRRLRHFLSFQGRSPRREFGWIWLAGGLLEVGRRAIAAVAVDEARMRALTALVADPLVIGLILAFAVRRLHDSGRHGGWALIGAPAALTTLWRDWVAVRYHLAFVAPPEGPLFWLLLASVIGFWSLMLVDDDPGANRYGPNPRGDMPEEAQLA